MQLQLNTAQQTAELIDVDDFGSFAVVVVDGGLPDALAAFPQDIRPAGEAEVWLAAKSVIMWGGRPTADWDSDFRAMLTAVESHGWYDRKRDEIKAHVVTRH